MDAEGKELEGAFGGDNGKGTGYVLFYRQHNRAMPADFAEMPMHGYLQRMVAKEDQQIKVQWQKWQKEMRSVTVKVTCKEAAVREKAPEATEAKEVDEENPVKKVSDDGK